MRLFQTVTSPSKSMNQYDMGGSRKKSELAEAIASGVADGLKVPPDRGPSGSGTAPAPIQPPAPPKSYEVSPETLAARDKYAQGYRPSQGVLSAQDALSQAQSARPGDYSSRYDAEIQSIYRQLMDRPAFRYDLYADPLYQQYKEQYRLLGSQAMMDTMGQASGLTGGYGSTYSQNAGQQAYNGYLQQLNDRVPQLYGLAYDRYDREGKQLLERYSLAQTGESRDYARWQDGYNRYLAQLQNAQNRYDSAYAQDYNAFRDMLTYWQNQVAQEQAQQNWQAELDYAREQWEYQKGKR